MGSAPKMPPVVVPDTTAQAAPVAPPPAMQPNPQASGVRKSTAGALAGAGMGSTVLTQPGVLTQQSTTMGKSLLGV